MFIQHFKSSIGYEGHVHPRIKKGPWWWYFEGDGYFLLEREGVCIRIRGGGKGEDGWRRCDGIEKRYSPLGSRMTVRTLGSGGYPL